MKLNFVVGACSLLMILLSHDALAQFNPELWKGDLSSFEISHERINLNAEAVSGEKYLSTPSQAINDAQWLIEVQLDFNPSSANLAKIYLVSDQQHLNAPLNGYFVMLGNSQDEISLYRQDGEILTKIIDGQDKRLNSSSVQIELKVSRSLTGDWILSSKVNDDTSFQIEGKIRDLNYKQSFFAGLQCIFTSTRSKKMHFTRFEVSGDAYVDSEPPVLSSCVAISASQLLMTFNETIQLTSEDVKITDSNLSIKQLNTDSNRVTIEFISSFSSNTDYHITIKRIQDQSGNQASNLDCNFRYSPFVITSIYFNSPSNMEVVFNKALTSKTIEKQRFSLNGQSPISIQRKEDNILILTFDTPSKADVEMSFLAASVEDIYGTQLVPLDSTLSYHIPLPLDVIFSEIMADPSPAVGLPEIEYIEIYNRSPHTLSLQNWILYINEKSITLPHAYLKPNSYALLCKDVSSFTKGTYTLPSISLPAIPNSEANLCLISADSICIDWIPYRSDMLENSFKADGGWSLERKDLDNFSYSKNWTSSKDATGGTPFQINSQVETVHDETGPYLISADILGDKDLRLGFNERVFLDTTQNLSIVYQSITQHPMKPNYLDIRLSESADSFLTSTIKLSNIKDMNGQACLQKSLSYALPKHLNPGDLIINELMINPMSDAPEYIELYNTTERFLDISELWIGKRNSDGLVEKAWDVATLPNILAPSSFLLLLSHASDTLYYHQNQLICPKLSLNNDSGSIVLMNVQTMLIDELSYKKEYHSPLIKDEKGVALERINPLSSTNDPNNWTSAAGTYGYATPGKKNSQLVSMPIQEDTWIEYSTRSVSPNGDGINDVLIIRLNHLKSNSAINSSVYTLNGKLLKHVTNNLSSGTSNTVKWDGTNDSGKRLSLGIYVLITKVYPPNGQEKIDKVAVAISAN